MKRLFVLPLLLFLAVPCAQARLSLPVRWAQVEDMARVLSLVLDFARGLRGRTLDDALVRTKLLSSFQCNEKGPGNNPPDHVPETTGAG